MQNEGLHYILAILVRERSETSQEARVVNLIVSIPVHKKARLITAKDGGYSMIREIQIQMARTRVPKLAGVS